MQSGSDSIVGPPQQILPIETKNDESKKNKRQSLLLKEENVEESSISRQLNFNVPSETTKERARISLFSKIQSTSSIQCLKQNALSPMNVQKSAVSTGNLVVVQNDLPPTMTAPVDDGSISKSTTSYLTKSGGNPRASNSDNQINPINKTNIIEPIQKNAEDLTPYKMFQIPSTRRLPPSNRRLAPDYINKSSQDSEFRSQKVLFTTPSAVSRPIINLLNNVGLDDSLNCYKSSPISMKSSPEKIQHHRHRHGAISSSEVIPNEHFVNEENASLQFGGEKKIIRINGKDFVVHRKIGQGGSSSVFLAEHKERNLECALKVCREIDDAIFRML